MNSTDEELTAALWQATPAARIQLRAAIDLLKDLITEGRPVVGWSPMTGEGSNADPLALSYPEYDEAVPQLITALVAVNAQPVFVWMRWDGSSRYPEGVGLADAPVADAMRLVTAIVRGQRFCDGPIAKAIEDSSLLSAAERIIDALDDHLADPHPKASQPIRPHGSGSSISERDPQSRVRILATCVL